MGGVREDCQKNKPVSEQLVAQLHQVTLEVVGQQGEKHWEGDWKKTQLINRFKKNISHTKYSHP